MSARGLADSAWADAVLSRGARRACDVSLHHSFKRIQHHVDCIDSCGSYGCGRRSGRCVVVGHRVCGRPCTGSGHHRLGHPERRHQGRLQGGGGSRRIPTTFCRPTRWQRTSRPRLAPASCNAEHILHRCVMQRCERSTQRLQRCRRCALFVMACVLCRWLA